MFLNFKKAFFDNKYSENVEYNIPTLKYNIMIGCCKSRVNQSCTFQYFTVNFFCTNKFYMRLPPYVGTL